MGRFPPCRSAKCVYVTKGSGKHHWWTTKADNFLVFHSLWMFLTLQISILILNLVYKKGRCGRCGCVSHRHAKLSICIWHGMDVNATVPNRRVKEMFSTFPFVSAILTFVQPCCKGNVFSLLTWHLGVGVSTLTYWRFMFKISSVRPG